MTEKAQWQRTQEAEHTYGGARGTLKTREAAVTLDASVTLFACLTLVTTGTLGSLEEKREQAIRRESRWHLVGCCPCWMRVLRA